MILCDTGPLVALIDSRQGEAHDNCRAIVDNLRDTLHTTWPCVTEAMYLAHNRRVANAGHIVAPACQRRL